MFTNGIPWLHDRKFVPRHLRDLGMGKTHLEVAIEDEARALVAKSFERKPTYHPVGLRTAVLNVIWQLVIGKRYDLTSKEVDANFNINENFRAEGSNLLFVESFFQSYKHVHRY